MSSEKAVIWLLDKRFRQSYVRAKKAGNRQPGSGVSVSDLFRQLEKET
jgi:hypothetical protein